MASLLNMLTARFLAWVWGVSEYSSDFTGGNKEGRKEEGRKEGIKDVNEARRMKNSAKSEDALQYRYRNQQRLPSDGEAGGMRIH